MSYRFKVTPNVQEEIELAEKIYAKYGQTTLDRFIGAIESTIDFLEEWPYASREIEGFTNVRMKTVSSKYPFAFYFYIKDEELDIIAFAFEWNKQDPEIIRELLSERLENEIF